METNSTISTGHMTYKAEFKAETVNNQTMEQHVIEVDIIGGCSQEKFIDSLMHTSDLFASSKVYAYHEIMLIKGNPDLINLCEKIKNAYSESGGYVVFVGIRSIDGVRSENPYAYFQPNVNSISMNIGGKLKFGLFKDILFQLGYYPATDNRMYVISVEGRSNSVESR